MTPVEVNNDERGMLDLNGISPACKEFRLSTRVDSTAPNEKIRESVASALKTDAWFAVFANRQEISTDLTVTARHTVQED